MRTAHEINLEGTRPAYPVQGMVTANGDVLLPDQGMTLRDAFAVAALQGWLSNPTPNDNNIDQVAAWTYRMADAMLKAREE